MSITQKQLRSVILSQKLQATTVYYSLAKKDCKTFSIMSNDRLLVLDAQQNIIYYINDYKSLPFKQVPRPKKQYVNVTNCQMKRESGSLTIELTFKFKQITIVWKYSFDTVDLTDQWVKLIEYQRAMNLTSEVRKSKLNQSIIYQMMGNGVSAIKVEQPPTENVVKEEYKNINTDESKLLDMFKNSILRQPLNAGFEDHQKAKSQIVRSSKQNGSPATSDMKFVNDWNYKFYKNRTLQTVYEFEQAAKTAFAAAIAQDQPVNSIRSYEQSGLFTLIADAYTHESKQLKKEFRNYHFILQSTKNIQIVGVPLACLFEYQGIVALVKAKFPSSALKYKIDAAFKDEIRDLQRYTRVRNKVLQNCFIYDLTEVYEKESPQKLLYLDEVIDYLPINLEFEGQGSTFRPEYILDHVNQFVQGGEIDSANKLDIRLIRDICGSIEKKSKQIAVNLSRDEVYFTHCLQVKDFFHQNGLNLKYLPLVYNEVSNKYVKKMLHTTMAAKITKDYLLQSISKISFENNMKVSFTKILDDTLRLVLEGRNNSSSQIWKQLAILFKKVYNTPLNNKQIMPGFYINSMMRLIPARYNCLKINLDKIVFEDSKVIDEGFVEEVLPKIKSYYRVLPEKIDQLKFAAKDRIKDETISNQLVKTLKLTDQGIPKELSLHDNKQWITSYLSYYYCPANLTDKPLLSHISIFQSVNEEPPSIDSLRITLNYLEWCNKREKTEQFRKTFQTAMAIVQYWLGDVHPFKSDLLESLSDYHNIFAENQEMIKFMKESLMVSSKFGGANSREMGLKYYQLADRYLRAGRKQQAQENFIRAKQNIEMNKTVTNKLGLTLMRMASIELSNGEYQKAIELANRSLKSFEQFQKKVNSLGIFNELQKIKNYEIMARIYQITDRKNQYKDIALQCSRKFNSTTNAEVYQIMVKIAIASAIFKSNSERSQTVMKLLDKITREGAPNFSSAKCLQDLMRMSQQSIVMQKCLNKFQHFERSLSQINPSKRTLNQQTVNFLSVLNLVVGFVGEDYINGLIEQNKYHFGL